MSSDTGAIVLTADEKKEFAKAAIEALNDPQNLAQFEKDIENIGNSAVQIDQAFDRVSRGFKGMVDNHGSDFPEVAGYKREWDGYKVRWVKYLWQSRDVASEMTAVLRRYDEVFLSMIDDIQTESDLRDCVKEFIAFSKEEHTTSKTMANNFRTLESDVRGFGERFSAYLAAKKVELEQQAASLKIVGALLALGAGLAAGLWSLVVTGISLAYFIAERIRAELELRKKKGELEEVNRKQRELAELKSRYDGLKPDIALIAEKLVVFGNIWDSVSTQIKEFGAILETGLDSLNNEEFRLQVTLARKTCVPLRNGLAKYAVNLENSSLPKQ
ncbi:hypothetical protein EST38_g10409 [Candolleomyces aberdarensis]|uniref:Uncharacterized protein n=1 Tax=Candolleomyces aberdarensis TaxID=2316362 RepID=A0A4Q2D7G8_9AGAR|nr:hypothetical protein EST38_g10409 [Candolleomyces aberdarensis]